MSDLSFHVREFLPDCQDGEEMELRKALLKAREYASVLKPRVASDAAYDLACQAHEVAGQYVYADVSTGRLEIARNLCRALVQAAMCTEHLEALQ